MPANLNDKRYESFVPYASDEGSNYNRWAVRTHPTTGSSILDISAESISVSAGAAGTTGVTKCGLAPVLDASKTRLGMKGDSSFAWITGTCLTTEVAFNYEQDDTTQLAALAQGEFAIDYNTGKIRYCKKTTATSDTANYSVRQLRVDTELTIEGVTIDNVKVFSTDGTATNSKYAFAMTDGGAADGSKHAAMMAGYDAVGGKAQHLRQMKGDAAANAGYHLSVAGEVVDFNTGAGTDYTPAIGILVQSSAGAIPLEGITQDAAFGTAAVGIPLFGKYQATPTTYTDGDACPVLLDQNGRIVLSSDIEIGAVEGKDGTTDNRWEIKVPNATAMGYGLNVMPARYMATPPALTDTYASPLLLDSQGKLVTAPATTFEYVDDANGFTVESSKGIAIMGVATTDAVHSGDVGALAMTTSRELLGKVKVWDGTNSMPTMDDKSRKGIVQLTDGTNVQAVTTSGAASVDITSLGDKAVNLGSGNIGTGTQRVCIASDDVNTAKMVAALEIMDDWDSSDNCKVDINAQTLTAIKVSKDANANAVNNPLFVACGDGTTTAVVETSGTKKALNVNVTDGTNDMPTADAVGRSLYAAVGDGTTTAVVETSGTKKALNVNITDGTNDMPTMDAAARAGFVELTDGTHTADIDASSNLMVNINAQSATALKVSKDANANTSSNPIWNELCDGAGNAVSVTTNALHVRLASDAVGLATSANLTAKTQMTQITDGTNEADVIATINSLKTDLSSIAGTATAVNAGTNSAGVQRVTLATDDAATVSLGLLDDTVLTGLQQKALQTTAIIPPAAHTNQTISEDSHAFDVTCTNANKVYSLGVAAGVIDGSNQYAVMELTLSLAEGTATPETIIVKVYRENTGDGGDPATTAIAERAMVSGSRVYIPYKPAWGTTAVKITCSSAGAHVYGDVTGVYYTP